MYAYLFTSFYGYCILSGLHASMSPLAKSAFGVFDQVSLKKKKKKKKKKKQPVKPHRLAVILHSKFSYIILFRSDDQIARIKLDLLATRPI